MRLATWATLLSLWPFFVATQGCSHSGALEAEVDKAIACRAADGKGMQDGFYDSVNSLLAYDVRRVVGVLQTRYESADCPANRACVAETARALALHQLPPDAREVLGSVAVKWLLDEDPRVMDSAVCILSQIEYPHLQDLIKRRLPSIHESSSLNTIAVVLAKCKAFDVIGGELNLRRPHDADANDLCEWRKHVDAALVACRQAALCGIAIPNEFPSAIVAQALNEDDLTESAVSTLIEIRPENVQTILREARDSAKRPSSRLAWEAGVIAVDSNPLGASHSALCALAEAVSSYSKGEECWPELLVRTRWLAFAAAYCGDEGVLSKLWLSLGGLHARDRAELLAIIAGQFLSHQNSLRTSTNQLVSAWQDAARRPSWTNAPLPS